MSSQWRTVHDRFQVLGGGRYDDGGELLETRESRIEAELVGAAYLDDFDEVLVFDLMARRGAWQTWRVTGEGLEELERRPLE